MGLIPGCCWVQSYQRRLKMGVVSSCMVLTMKLFSPCRYGLKLPTLTHSLLHFYYKTIRKSFDVVSDQFFEILLIYRLGRVWIDVLKSNTGPVVPMSEGTHFTEYILEEPCVLFQDVTCMAASFMFDENALLQRMGHCISVVCPHGYQLNCFFGLVRYQSSFQLHTECFCTRSA